MHAHQDRRPRTSARSLHATRASSEGKRAVISGVSPCPGREIKRLNAKNADRLIKAQRFWPTPILPPGPMPWVETELVFQNQRKRPLSEKNRIFARSEAHVGGIHQDQPAVATRAARRRPLRRRRSPEARSLLVKCRSRESARTRARPISSSRPRYVPRPTICHPDLACRRNRLSRQIPRPACAPNRRCRDRRLAAASPCEASAPLWTCRGAFWARTPSCPVRRC